MNKSTQIQTLAKLTIQMNGIYDTFTKEKKLLLNNDLILKYLFIKPIRKLKTLSNIKSEYIDDIPHITLPPSQNLQIESSMYILMTSWRSYEKLYLSYKKISTETGTNFDNKLPNLLATRMEIPEFASKYRLIAQTLNKIGNKIAMSYVYKWSFAEDVVDNVPKVYIFKQNFTYDFFGIITKSRRLKQFVIEYKKNYQTDDFIKQYILFQMNVHLLRLNPNSHIETEVNRFIRKIIRSDKYVIRNRIVCTKDLSRENAQLKIFYDSYFHNHLLFIQNAHSDDGPDAPITETEPGDKEYKIDPHLQIRQLFKKG